jgi:L-ascorbate metabolism protein UlaG (beta-lactamase superfamily)
MAKITWYGHSCVLIETQGTRLLIDPFLTGNPVAPVRADAVHPRYILVSHGHGDHLGDTVAIAKRTGATVISNFELSDYFAAQGVENTHAQHIGGGYNYPWGRVKLTIAHHGSGLPDGSNGGDPAGFLLYLEGKKVYHAGDTGLFYDMKLIGEEGIDLAILPIGDNFTMGPDDALKAVKLIEPRQVVPIHYNTFDVIKQDAQAWARRVQNETSAEVIVMKPGDTLEL